MVAYSFKSRFAPLILDGSKTQTIRADRRRHARPGEVIQLFTGMRTRHCKLLRHATCTAVLPITLHFRAGLLSAVSIAALRLTGADLHDFARSDGFADAADMAAFWSDAHQGGDLDWSGVLIKWRPDAGGTPALPGGM